MEKLESQMDVLKNEKASLALKLEAASKASESENSRLKEENGKLKAQYREQDRRARLLRQGLVLREANDWALEQEIQRLANLLSDQPEVNTPKANRHCTLLAENQSSTARGPRSHETGQSR